MKFKKTRPYKCIKNLLFIFFKGKKKNNQKFLKTFLRLQKNCYWHSTWGTFMINNSARTFTEIADLSITIDWKEKNNIHKKSAMNIFQTQMCIPLILHWNLKYHFQENFTFIAVLITCFIYTCSSFSDNFLVLSLQIFLFLSSILYIFHLLWKDNITNEMSDFMTS